MNSMGYVANVNSIKYLSELMLVDYPETNLIKSDLIEISPFSWRVQA